MRKILGYHSLLLLFAASSACGGNSTAAPDAGADAGSPDADRGAIPRVEPATCRFMVPAALALTVGTDYQCGDLIAYENRDTPGRTIKMHYIRIAAAAQTGDATIYLDGGPGGNGQDILDFAGALGASFLDGLRGDGDFLVIAQRGTSLSDPILDDQPTDVDLPSYNTGESADDVDDLRAALGYQRLNLYGISYGSRLALEVLRRHGDHVRAASIGGIVPAQINWEAHIPASFYSSLTALDASCTADGGCGAAFGALEPKFLAGVDSLNQTPVTISFEGNPIDVDGQTYASLLFTLLYSRRTYPWLPLLINDLAARRVDRVGGFIGDSLSAIGSRTPVSQGLYDAVVCGELFNPPNPSAFDTANADVPSAIRDLYGGSWASMLSECQGWIGPSRADLDLSVASSVRTLIDDGAIDPITPPPFGALAATTLSDSVTVLFANSGHGATLQSPCGQAMLSGFLANPTAMPDTTCAAALTTTYMIPGAMAAAAAPSWSMVRAELGMAPIPPTVRRRLDSALRGR